MLHNPTPALQRDALNVLFNWWLIRSLWLGQVPWSPCHPEEGGFPCWSNQQWQNLSRHPALLGGQVWSLLWPPEAPGPWNFWEEQHCCTYWVFTPYNPFPQKIRTHFEWQMSLNIKYNGIWNAVYRCILQAKTISHRLMHSLWIGKNQHSSKRW